MVYVIVSVRDLGPFIIAVKMEFIRSRNIHNKNHNKYRYSHPEQPYCTECIVDHECLIPVHSAPAAVVPGEGVIFD